MVAVAGFDIGDQVSDRPTCAIWRATDLTHRRPVALKRIHATSPLASDRLRTVGAVLTRSPHPNIVQVYDFVSGPDALWLVEEWVEAVRLDKLSADPITAQQSVATITGALEGLAHAHQHGVVHGDISPANILLTPSGSCRLIDFGLTGPIGITGLPAAPKFASPESARGQVPTTASDVYSAAGVLARLLAKGATAIRSIPRPLRPVLNKALSPQAADRYPGAREFLSELSRAADESFGFGWQLATLPMPVRLGTGDNAAAAEIPRQRRSRRRALTIR